MKVIALVFTILPTVLMAQNIIRGPYLQSPSENSIIIKWRTDTPTDSKINFGTVATNLSQTATASTNVVDHEITLTGLTANTTYYYEVGNGTQVLNNAENLHFKTHPTIGTVDKYRTWVIGDFGKGNQSQTDVMNSYLTYNDDTHTDVWLWMGDNAYQDGQDSEYQTNVFDKYDSIFPYIPFYPTPGNHDYNSMNNYSLFSPTNHTNHEGAYYDIVSVPTNGEVGGLASGTEAFYSFDHGNVHYISLNSEVQNYSFRNTDMENWLTNDLNQNTQDWTIVYWHQAPYSKGSHDSDDIWELVMRGMREHILPILDAHNVDLVLCGHSHNYERSYLMEGHYETSSDIQPNMYLSTASGNPTQGEEYVKYYGPTCDYKGIVYAVMGNSGSKTGPGDDEGLNHPVMYVSDAEDAVGSLILDIHGDTLNGTYIRATGQVVDEFRILRKEDCSLIANVEETEKDLLVKVYSNHETGEFKIRFDLTKASDVAINLYDLQGKVIYTKDFGQVAAGDHYHTIDSRSLGIPTGIYYFSIHTPTSKIGKKVFMLEN